MVDIKYAKSNMTSNLHLAAVKSHKYNLVLKPIFDTVSHKITVKYRHHHVFVNVMLKNKIDVNVYFPGYPIRPCFLYIQNLITRQS